MASFRLIPSSNFNQQLKTGVQREMTRQFFSRVAFSSPKIISNVGNFLIKIFESTEVARSLRGDGGTDLPAHFGLTNSQANTLVDGMAKVILNSIAILTKPTGNTGIVQIRAINSNFAEFLALPSAEYVSSTSGVSIPVMRWLMIDPDIDIGQAAFDIVFSGEFGGKFNSQIESVSRSGRAIMVALKTLGGGGGYLLPSIVRGSLGTNFLEFVIRQPGVASSVTKIVLESVL